MNKSAILLFYQKYKLILFPLAVTLSSLVLIFLVITPQISRLLDTNRNIDQLSKKNAFLEAKAQELAVLDGEDLQTKLNLALLALPQETDFANLIGVILNLSSQAQFSLVSFQTDRVDPKTGSKASAYGVRLILSGPKETLETLLSDIEQNSRVMKVTSVEYTAVRSDEPIDVQLGIEVYYSSIPSSLGAVDTPLPKLSDKDETIIATLARNIQQSLSVSQISVSGPRGKANPFE